VDHKDHTAAEEKLLHWHDDRPKGTGLPRSEFRKTLNLWRSSTAVMKTVMCTVTGTFVPENFANGNESYRVRKFDESCAPPSRRVKIIVSYSS